MFQVVDYRCEARKYEDLFRKILRDMKENGDQRPAHMGTYIPSDLDTELPLDELFERYSTGNRYGRFTICSFKVEGDSALISFQDVAPLSGGGAVWHYQVQRDTVRYNGISTYFRS